MSFHRTLRRKPQNPSSTSAAHGAAMLAHLQQLGGAFPRKQYSQYLAATPDERKRVKRTLKERTKSAARQSCRERSRHQLDRLTRGDEDLAPITLGHTSTSHRLDGNGVISAGHAWDLSKIVVYPALVLHALEGSDLQAGLLEELKLCEPSDQELVDEIHRRIGLPGHAPFLQAAPRRRAQIPKVSFNQPLTPENLTRFLKGTEDQGPIKLRPLVYGGPMERLLARTVAETLENWMFYRWSSSVACRLGGRIPSFLAALEQAVRKTGRTWMLMADLQDFFGSCRKADALNLLERETGYRTDPAFTRYLTSLLASGGVGSPDSLPQGNPLSPILANLIGADRIDRHAVRHGPTIRYVDDVLVLVESREAALETFRHLSVEASKHGLTLHGQKSLIVDLMSQETFGCDGSPVPTNDPIRYLGFELGWSGSTQTGHLTISLSDRAVWNLALSLREAVTDFGSETEEDEATSSTPLRDRCRLPIQHGRLVQRVLGWLQFYGCAQFTPEHRQHLRAILLWSGLTGPQIAQHLQDSDQDNLKAAAITLQVDPAGIRSPGELGDAWERKMQTVCDRSSRQLQADRHDPPSLAWYLPGTFHPIQTRPERQRAQHSRRG